LIFGALPGWKTIDSARYAIAMDLYQHHRRTLIWLHWMVASTAGAGTMVAVYRAMERLVWPPPGENLIESHIALILLGFLLLICLATIGAIQHVILQQVGLSQTWITATIVGVAFGVFACMLFMVVIVGLTICGLRRPVFFVSGLLFSFGAGLGFLQCRDFATSWAKRRVWILLNGLFPPLVIGLSLTGIFAASRPIEFGLCLGLLYGFMTGPCLAWMAPAAAAAHAEGGFQLRIADLGAESS
jgi:hypothetical protein